MANVQGSNVRLLTVLSSHEFGVIDLMFSLRACQCVGGPLYNAGAFERSKEVFLQMISKCVSADYSKFVPDKMLAVLLKGENLASAAGVSARDSAFMLRRSVDILYDHFMNRFCIDVNYYKSRLDMQVTRELLNNAMNLMKDEKFEEAQKVYGDIANGLLKDARQVLSQESRSSLEVSLADAKKAASCQDACEILRKSTESCYNETRVPEECVAMEKRSNVESQEGLAHEQILLVDFRGEKFLADEWQVNLYSDQTINGESTSLFVPPQEQRPFALWYGSISTVNYGGYATFQMVPKSANSPRISKSTVGVKLWLRNNSRVNSRFTMALYPDAKSRFHWDFDFELRFSESFQPVFMPLKSFWPTIYGHSLGLPGQSMDLDGVCVFGLAISRTFASGKANTDLKDGEYSIAMEKIFLVNHKADAELVAAEESEGKELLTA